MKAISQWWPREYVFLLTHADWGGPALAALLSQQLGVHGVGCSGLAYERTSDLMRLRWLIARDGGWLPRGRFLFDTLVDNEQYLPLQLTASPKLRALICVHRPVATLLSMLNAGVAQSLREAEHLYRDRLEWLAAVGPNLNERALVFPAEMVVEDTNVLLAAIALHLGIESTFEPIAQPLLDADERCESAPASELPRSVALDIRVRERCEDAYHDTLRELCQTCLSIGIMGDAPEVDDAASVVRPRASQVTSGRPGFAAAMICDRFPAGTLQ